ncbi:phenylalanine ammonia-lyase [Aspergillus pseudonomiae]|uniref:Phenylalanine ammonia-lyase n=1 Tax=Aspergillus pseudonomiae TaxID=1506151 RepID=A0A5N7CU82_9EURO|nr:phenylalanine ammonia-lyase [Aspergillus pseudonomiae]KAB8257989.1 phenylalanine ammonia-lyase [Aspergillus pseudonomiae]KAE8397766.1 phenylalanine ammonia-lyase [Aspergillus pseudonomiae]
MGSTLPERVYDVHNQWPTPHAHQALQSWARLNSYTKAGTIQIDGKTLDVAAIVAIARNGVRVAVTEDTSITQRIEDSVETLQDYLSKGYYLYGVNTGFGGSADTRTTDLYGLQRALMQHTQSAVLTEEDKVGSSKHEYLESHSMPSAWTRAMTVIRCNANIRGHSAMTRNVVDTMIKLLDHDIVPIVPLRGSISASGDLMPLSYLSGAIQGNPDVYVRVGGLKGNAPRVLSAFQALKEASIEPIILGPKEGLSLINGTAAAAAVASLACYEANQLALVSQLLTALMSEVLYANNEWAHPFIAAVRPHQGQIEAAQNIRTFLYGSQLSYGLEQTKDRFSSGLAQERYALRSSPQWLSPQLEDLLTAEKQLEVELNSTSDNPVVNTLDDDIHCGANFQAAAVTSATEKIRLALQSIGKILFSQTTEAINHGLNNGLPPNLAADDPSLSFCLKGIDVNTAAYTSELGFLANPVSNHVQSAEMHNQAVNSLGLLSARQTMAAVEVLSLIVANALYTACQGVDLRALHRTFIASLKAPARKLIITGLFVDTQDPVSKDRFFTTFWKEFEEAWYAAAAYDAAERAAKAAQSLAVAVVNSQHIAIILPVEKVTGLTKAFESLILQSYLQHRDAFFKQPSTAQYLGQGTRMIYRFVREKLGVPLHRGLVEHPVAGDQEGNVIDGRPKKTIGSWVSIIYEAVRDGSLYAEVFQFLDASGGIANGVKVANGTKVSNGTNGSVTY